MSAKWKQIFLLNLQLLGIDKDGEISQRKISLHPNMFDKPNNAGFNVLIYHLLKLIDPAKCDSLFKSCYPPVDKKRVLEFRKHACPWLRQISDMYPDHNIPKVKSTLMLSPCGNEAIALLNSLSSFVIFKFLEKNGPGKAPLPPRSKERLRKAQCKFFNTMAVHDKNDLIKTMELIKKTDQEILKLAKELSNEFHSLQKRNKIGLKSAEKLNAIGFTSESKMIAAKHQEIKSLQGMWKTLENAHHIMSEKSDTVEHLITRTEENILCLDGNEFEVAVPTFLIEKCQEEIYRNVGSTLYENEKVNLSSLLFLWNLSLKLLLEKMYSVDLPNFEKPIHNLQTLLKVLEMNKVKLFDISRNLPNSYEKVKSDKQKYTSLLHNMIKERESSYGDTLFDQSDDIQSEVQQLNFVGRFEEIFLTTETDFLQDDVTDKIEAKETEKMPTINNTNPFLIENKENIPKLSSSSATKIKKEKNIAKKKMPNNKGILKPGFSTSNRLEKEKPASEIVPLVEEVVVPASENKLMDMIVDEVMDDKSPIGVYQQDSISQLDASAFVSLDKLARSPITKTTNQSGKENMSIFFEESNFLSPLATKQTPESDSVDSKPEKFSNSAPKPTADLKDLLTQENSSNSDFVMDIAQSAGLDNLINFDDTLEKADFVGAVTKSSSNNSLASSLSNTPDGSYTTTAISQACVDQQTRPSITDSLDASTINHNYFSDANKMVIDHQDNSVVDMIDLTSTSPKQVITTTTQHNNVENVIEHFQTEPNTTTISSSASSSNRNSTHDSISPPVSTSISASTSRSNSPFHVQPGESVGVDDHFDFDIDMDEKNWMDELEDLDENDNLGEEPPLIDFDHQPTVSSFDLLVSSPVSGLQTPLL